MFKSKSQNKSIVELLQEDKKHILVPASVLTDLNNISSIAKVDQQKISVEIFKLGLLRIAKKYHLVPLVQDRQKV